MIGIFLMLAMIFTSDILDDNSNLPVKMEDTCKGITYRLPTNYPLNLNYTIFAHHNLVKDQYKAKIIMNFIASSVMPNITVNAADNLYTISAIEVFVVRPKSVQTTLNIQNITRCTLEDQISLHFQNKDIIETGDNVTVSFTIIQGKAKNNPAIHKSKDVYSLRVLIMGEPTAFRHALPSFDEPGIRAHFTLYIARNKAEMSASNEMKLASLPIGTDENKTPCEFMDSSLPTSLNMECDVYPKSEYTMSTYLFTYLIAADKLKPVWLNITVPTFNALNILLYTTPDDAEYYINTLLRETASYVEEGIYFFNSSFPGRTLQNVLTQMNIKAGGEELWNLVAYSTMKYLDASGRKIIGHEVAHHWIGNLITITDWEELWIKEGSASYLSDMWYSNIHNKSRDLSIRKQRGLDYLDSICSKPVKTTIDRNTTFMDIYNYRPYYKSEFLLKMLERNIYGSVEPMKRGYRNLIRMYSGQAINGSQFWAAFERNENFPDTVENLITPWFRNLGKPVITIHSCNFSDISKIPQTCQIFVTQNYTDSFPNTEKWSYVKLGLSTNPSEKETSRWIPHNKNVSLFLNFSNHTNFPWIFADYFNTGYYEVHYDESMVYMFLLVAEEADAKDQFDCQWENTFRDILISSLECRYNSIDMIMRVIKIVLKQSCFSEETFNLVYEFFSSMAKTSRSVDAIQKFVSEFTKNMKNDSLKDWLEEHFDKEVESIQQIRQGIFPSITKKRTFKKKNANNIYEDFYNSQRLSTKDLNSLDDLDDDTLVAGVAGATCEKVNKLLIPELYESYNLGKCVYVATTIKMCRRSKKYASNVKTWLNHEGF